MHNRHQKTKKFLVLAGHLVRVTLLFFALLSLATYWLWNNHKDKIYKIDKKILKEYVNHYSHRLNVAKKIIGNPGNGSFQAFWASEGEQFSAKRYVSLPNVPITGKPQTVRVPINKDNIEKLRLDFPDNIAMDVEIISLFVITKTKKLKIDLGKIKLKFNDMVQKSMNSFAITGTDPFLWFHLPGGPSNGQVLGLEAEIVYPLNPAKLSEASAMLEDLIADMGNVNKQDRLAVTYPGALEKLLSVKRQEADLDGALSTAKRLVDFNGNHYRYWLEYAKELGKNGRKEESVEAYYKSYAIAPSSIDVVGPFASMLFDNGQYKEAEMVVKGYLNSNRVGTFETFWVSEGEQFSAKKRASLRNVTISGRQKFIKMPINDDKITRLRLDFPGIPYMSVKIMDLFVESTAGEIEIDLNKNIPKLNDMIQTGKTRFSVRGGDPYIYFNMPPHLSNEKLLSLNIRAIISQELSPGLKSIIQGHSVL